MSNQAKDWQEGTYTIRVKDNLVSANVIRQVREKGPYGDYWRNKEFTATAKCDPEDEFSLSMGVALAMDRLNKQLDEERGGIKVGDRVKIKDEGLSYTTYTDWIKKNIKDVGLVACYAYCQIPKANDTVYVVKAIAPWGTKSEDDKDKKLAYVQQYFKFSNGKISDNEVCYLMRIDGLEKVYE